MNLAALADAGLDRSAVRKRVSRGVLHRKYAGVYAIGHPNLTPEGEWYAAVLAAGEGAVLSHRSAAALRGIWRHAVRVAEVLAPRGRRPKGPVLVRSYRRLDPADVTIHKGIPVTTVARTLVDLTDTEDSDSIAGVIHEAEYRGLFDEEETRAAMKRANGRRNLAVLEAALAARAAGSAGAKSRAERAFRRLVGPEPLNNVLVEGIEVDFLWPDRRLVVEVDGPAHLRPRTKREDELKRRILERAGYTVLRFTDREIERHPERVRARLRAGATGRPS